MPTALRVCRPVAVFQRQVRTDLAGEALRPADGAVAADVDGAVVATALAAVLEAEEIALEEQAVLVALRGPARPAIHARHRDDTRISRLDPESTGDGSAA